MTEPIRTIDVDGVNLALRITRKRVKNINARLVDGELRVSAPSWVSRADVESAAAELARTLVRRERAREVNRQHDAFELARRVAGRFPEPPVINGAQFSTAQQSRWGSYSVRSGSIRLNAALRTMPAWVLEAVVAHELVHVSHPDHSPAFWRLLRRVCPETDRARAFLEGVSWLGGAWGSLPPVERGLLGSAGANDEPPGQRTLPWPDPRRVAGARGAGRCSG
jgi:predicted metal-dependent hydrolase